MSGNEKAAMNDTQELHVVVFQEEEYWVAQCIEYDIGAQGKTLDDMIAHFALTVDAELRESAEREIMPFSSIDPAPPYFKKMWDGRSSTLEPIQRDDTNVSRYEMALVA